MSLYRVKQFYYAITSKINNSDIEIINEYLNSYERSLFSNLAVYEQKHSVNVARDVMSMLNNKNNKKSLIKAALLHDIGKIYGRLNPIEKSIMVMLNSISKGNIKKYKKIKKIDIYYNHAEKGYRLLKETGEYDERFLYIIKNHHNNYINGDEELDIIRQCDNKN